VYAPISIPEFSIILHYPISIVNWLSLVAGNAWLTISCLTITLWCQQLAFLQAYIIQYVLVAVCL
jgi:hypothetical protein